MVAIPCGMFKDDGIASAVLQSSDAYAFKEIVYPFAESFELEDL